MAAANNSITVSPGDDLFRLAAIYYGDANAWTILARANGLTDPVIQASQTLIVPAYSAVRANAGILANQ